MKGVNLGPKNGNWNGGRAKTKHGYILIKNRDHPNANKSGYILEHRLIMSEHLGRPLKLKEEIHHKNRKKSDNRLCNLILCKNRLEHFKLHRGDPRKKIDYPLVKCKVCGLPQRAKKLCNKHWWENYWNPFLDYPCPTCGSLANHNHKDAPDNCFDCFRKLREKNKICQICGKKSVATKLCGLHFQRWRKRGYPLKNGVPDIKAILKAIPIGWWSQKRNRIH